MSDEYDLMASIYCKWRPFSADFNFGNNLDGNINKCRHKIYAALCKLTPPPPRGYATAVCTELMLLKLMINTIRDMEPDDLQ